MPPSAAGLPRLQLTICCFLVAASSLLTVVDVANTSDGSLLSDLGVALSRMANAKSVSLLPGLTLDRKSEVPETESSLKLPRRPSLSQLVSATERLFESHSLYWNLMPGVDLTVSAPQGRSGDFQLGVATCNHRQERTFKFGMMRRMKLIMLPIMYKLGVITTLLTLLTVFALKGLTIGVLLLIMSTAGFVAKFKWSHPHGGGGYWSPEKGKEVHVHLHGGSHGHEPSHHLYSHPSSPYDEWVRQDGPESWTPPEDEGGGGAGRPWRSTQLEQQPPQGITAVHHYHRQRVVPPSAAAAGGPPPSLPFSPTSSSSSPWSSYLGDGVL